MPTRLAALLALVLSAPAFGQQHTISFPSAVSYETGDTWSHEGRKFRLYGVQACLRGTIYHLADGEQGDCGMRSVASLAALFSTGTAACQPIGTAQDQVTFVVCAAQIEGATVDVGTALIASGAAFAATLPSGVPVASAYAVAETTAKQHRNGLWAGTFSHPVTLLSDGR